MLFAVVPNGTATGLDIGLSNFSLSLITLSFYTMCKSTTPVFLLFFCFAWGLERCAATTSPPAHVPYLPSLHSHLVRLSVRAVCDSPAPSAGTTAVLGSAVDANRVQRQG